MCISRVKYFQSKLLELPYDALPPVKVTRYDVSIGEHCLDSLQGASLKIHVDNTRKVGNLGFDDI